MNKASLNNEIVKIKKQRRIIPFKPRPWIVRKRLESEKQRSGGLDLEEDQRKAEKDEEGEQRQTARL